MKKGKDSKYRVTPTRKRLLKVKYGLTVEAYDALLESQNYVCKICQSSQVDKRKEGFRGLDVDHDHATGRVRGLLCNRCNTMLGVAQDNQTILLRAIQYLKGNL